MTKEEAFERYYNELVPIAIENEELLPPKEEMEETFYDGWQARDAEIEQLKAINDHINYQLKKVTEQAIEQKQRIKELEERLDKNRDGGCFWKFVLSQDKDGMGFYETGCGQAIMLHPKYEEDALRRGLVNFGIQYCCYCGNPIMEKVRS